MVHQSSSRDGLLPEIARSLADSHIIIENVLTLTAPMCIHVPELRPEALFGKVVGPVWPEGQASTIAAPLLCSPLAGLHVQQCILHQFGARDHK